MNAQIKENVFKRVLWLYGLYSLLNLFSFLLGYHFYCYRLLLDFQDNRNRYSHKWYRVFNEIPVVIMVIALYLVVFKPF